ncbi:FMN-binding protein MioC [Pseudoalteromonas sp. T1lg48]|uniref:FMN-binding protein MioC n=1 Tax=Pseudoalteromonas sp. T1lg48 TaxID=2077100 RepID=UPI000CF5FA91|nr:FMN-binding protein MioC [Pseudoalteromonas sp. T1lg48]
MKQLEIIIGSQMGGTEYVAEHLSQLLADLGVESQLHEQPDLQQISFDQPWLICTSTHGAGDYPDNLLAFIEQLAASERLNQVRFAVIGVGDSSYDTFNFAAKNIVTLLQTKGATLLLPQLEIDVLGDDLPEDTAEQWLPSLLQAWKSA